MYFDSTDIAVRPEDAQEESNRLQIPILQSDIIYQLSEEYQEYQYKIQQEEELEALKDIIRPSKIKVLPFIFRQCKPCIVGVEVLSGILTPKVDLINRDNKVIGHLLQITG